MVGQRLSDHPDIRKLGFTGSTPIGKQIMKRYPPTDAPLGPLNRALRLHALVL